MRAFLLSALALLFITFLVQAQHPPLTKISHLSPTGTYGTWGGYVPGGRLVAITGSYEDGSHATSVFKTQPVNAFSTPPPIANLQGLYWSSSAWGDYDGDGDLDLIVIGDYEEVHQTILYRNDGNEVFTEVPNTGLVPIRMGTPAWRDFDRDGDLDLLLVGQRGGHGSSDNVAELYRNEGGVFVNMNAGLQGRRHASAAWGDYDNDFYPDLVIMGTVGWDDMGGTVLYHNNHGASFTEIPTDLPDAEYGTVAWADFDNDEDFDILINGTLRSPPGPIARVYRNDRNAPPWTDGVFTDINAGLIPGSIGTHSASWGDYDGDDFNDIAIATEGIVRVYRNQGGSFVETFSAPGPIFGTVEWGNCNGDWLQDLLVVGTAQQGTNFAEIYRSNVPFPPGNPIYNGTFDFGLNYWQFYTNGVATASWGEGPLLYSDRFGEIQITAPGSNTQLYQAGITLQPYTRYGITFSAFSSSGHDMSVALHKNGTPFTSYGLNKTVDLPSGWSHWSMNFITSGFSGTVTDARLRFSFGQFATAGDRYGITDVYISEINPSEPLITQHPEDRTVLELQQATFTLTATGAAPLTYQWLKNNIPIVGAQQATYTTPPATLADDGTEFQCIVSNPHGSVSSAIAYLHVLPARNMINNPGFEEGTQQYSFYSNGTATFGTYPHITPGGVKCGGVFISTPGTNVQLAIARVYMEPNTTYQLSFDAYSNTGHNMSVYLHRNSPPYANLGINNWAVDLTTEWKNFTRVFTTPAISGPTSDTRLRFWFAPFDVSGDQFFIDNIWLSKVGAPPATSNVASNVPVAFRLNQNYPNPFNPVTMISYDLPVSSHVSLKVYDLLGREVGTLVDSHQEAGFRSAEWDASALPSGVYFCRIIAGEYQQQIKMMLVK